MTVAQGLVAAPFRLRVRAGAPRLPGVLAICAAEIALKRALANSDQYRLNRLAPAVFPIDYVLGGTFRTLTRNRPTRRMRQHGVQNVDARTGGQVSLRAAVTREVAFYGTVYGLRAILRTRLPLARGRERTHPARPLAHVLLPFAPELASITLPPWHMSFAARVARIVTIRVSPEP